MAKRKQQDPAAVQRAIDRIASCLHNYDEPNEDYSVQDMLSDIRHYCDECDLDFAQLDRMAYMNYTAEK